MRNIKIVSTEQTRLSGPSVSVSEVMNVWSFAASPLQTFMSEYWLLCHWPEVLGLESKSPTQSGNIAGSQDGSQFNSRSRSVSPWPWGDCRHRDDTVRNTALQSKPVSSYVSYWVKILHFGTTTICIYISKSWKGWENIEALFHLTAVTACLLSACLDCDTYRCNKQCVW